MARLRCRCSIGRARAAARRRAASPSAPSSPWWAAAALPLALPLPFPARRQPARLGAQARLGALLWAGRAGIVHCTVILALTGAAAVLAPQIPACDAAICTAFAASPCHKLSGCVPDFRPSNEEADSQVYRPPAAGAPNAPRAASAPLFWLSASSCLRCRLITMPYFAWLADRSIKVHSTLIAHPG